MYASTMHMSGTIYKYRNTKEQLLKRDTVVNYNFVACKLWLYK